MSRPFEGVRVIEVAAWTFVPGAGAIMADLGADVIKVEPPTGDPQRGLMNLLNSDELAANPFVEIPNRGKRSITLNLAEAAGTEVLRGLVAKADVFLTSYLPTVRVKLGIDVDDLCTENPRLIYVRGSGWGSRGPLADVGGFDAAAAWSAAGTQHKLTPPGSSDPVMQPAAFYDLQGSSAIAGATAMALFRRERVGKGGVVDVSLLNTGMWTMSPDLVVAATGSGEIPRLNRREAPNPIVNYYRTKDDRWINLVCLQSDRFWAELCQTLGKPDLATDARFADAASRLVNREECIAALDQVFGTRTLADWQNVLADFSGVWSTAATFEEVCSSAPVTENGYLPEVVGPNGRTFRLVAPPYQFDNEVTAPQRPAPELGQHTEEVLIDAGYSWEDIDKLRARGVLS